jgi:hypothetical protein
MIQPKTMLHITPSIRALKELTGALVNRVIQHLKARQQSGDDPAQSEEDNKRGRGSDAKGTQIYRR